ncbi:MAG TPA: SseB family protein [Acidiferrobacteraceae bacterium]|nr:SseB family protein [Acidiferrobacteraceae bacterium]HEX20709.1 SseB family protein [Acidiferrobacteraceae bacterium]
MSEKFLPKNDLEEKMLAAQNGHMPSEQFMLELLDMQVFIPISDSQAIGGFNDHQKAMPLTVKDEAGPEVLILFTSPERSRPFTDQFPEINGGLLEHFRWVLDRVGSGISISINPEVEVGIDFDPQMVTQLIHLSAQQQTES